MLGTFSTGKPSPSRNTTVRPRKRNSSQSVSKKIRADYNRSVSCLSNSDFCEHVYLLVICRLQRQRNEEHVGIPCIRQRGFALLTPFCCILLTLGKFTQ